MSIESIHEFRMKKVKSVIEKFKSQNEEVVYYKVLQKAGLPYGKLPSELKDWIENEISSCRKD